MNWQDNSAKNEENYDEMSDAQIVELALINQEFFSHIINRYKTKLFIYIRRISNLEPEEAEDVLQDVFIKVYQNLNDFDTSLKFSSWIYRITHNQVISNFRKISARPQKGSYDLEDDMVKNIASELDMTRDMDSSILKDNISKVLLGIDAKYREILILKFLEEKSYNEISDIIKKPVGTVGSMMNKAKKEFKKELESKKINI